MTTGVVSRIVSLMKNATRHVIRNLMTETKMLTEVGTTFPMDDVATYRALAGQWLKDNSELRTKTIEGADWWEVFRHFKEQVA